MNNHDEEKAKSSVVINRNISKKSIKLIFKQQFKLTIIQYIFSILMLFTGIIFNNLSNNIKLDVGTVTIKDIVVQNLDINIGTILILTSIYMIVKITLNLNIKLDKEKSTNDIEFD